MRIARSTRLMPLALAAALTLSACSNDQPASFESSDSKPAAGTAEGTPDAAAETTPADESAGDEGETAETTIDPAAEQTIELEESMDRSSEDEAFTLTTHRVLVHDYYVEAEVTLVNDGDEQLAGWYGSSSSSPNLFDDRGRTYAFQVPAGYDGESLWLQPGEGVEAVLVFAGRVDPEASQLTLDFSDLGEVWSQVDFQVPLAGQR